MSRVLTLQHGPVACVQQTFTLGESQRKAVPLRRVGDDPSTICNLVPRPAPPSEDLSGGEDLVVSSTAPPVPASGPPSGAGPLLEFFDPVRIAASLQEQGYGVAEAVRLLVEIAQDPDAKARDRIRAATELRAQIKESLRLSGALVQVLSRAQDTQDGVRREVTSLQTIVRQMSPTEQMLRAPEGHALPPPPAPPVPPESPESGSGDDATPPGDTPHDDHPRAPEPHDPGGPAGRDSHGAGGTQPEPGPETAAPVSTPQAPGTPDDAALPGRDPDPPGAHEGDDESDPRSPGFGLVFG